MHQDQLSRTSRTTLLDRSSQEFLALSRAAKELHVGYKRLRAAVQDGELPGYRLGERNIRVLWGDVVRWLRTQRVASSDHARERVAEILDDDAQKETAARA